MPLGGRRQEIAGGEKAGPDCWGAAAHEGGPDWVAESARMAAGDSPTNLECKLWLSA